MAIASTVERYLRDKGIDYDIIRHPRTMSSMETAQIAHIPGDQLIKSVILEDDDRHYVMAVVPATHQVRLSKVSKELNRPLHLADEREIGPLFGDCDLGAVPPMGPAYGMETIIDDVVTSQPEVYFEAGDHEALVHLRADALAGLLPQAKHARFSRRL